MTPLSITSLSQSKVYDDLFSIENETEMDHIALSRWADVILIALQQLIQYLNLSSMVHQMI